MNETSSLLPVRAWVVLDASPPDSVAAVAVDTSIASVSVGVAAVAPLVSCADASVELSLCSVVVHAPPPSDFAYGVCPPI